MESKDKNQTSDSLNVSEVEASKLVASSLSGNEPRGEKKAQDVLNDKENNKDGLYEPTKEGAESRKSGSKRGELLNRAIGAPKSALSWVKLNKGKTGIIGLVTSIIFAIGLLPAGLSIATLIPDSITDHNDSTSTVFSRRFSKAFGFMTKTPGVCEGSKIKCKMGKISNKALRRLAKKDIVPIDKNGNPMKPKRSGYPSENPSRYKVKKPDGSIATIESKNLKGFLLQKENRALAKSVWGRGGAFNMRFRAWSGKYIQKKLFTRFGIGRDGGIISKSNSKKKLGDRLKSTLNRPSKKDDVKNASKNVRDRMKKRMGKLKRGGLAYSVAAGGCIAVKAPRFVAAGVAAVQLAQLAPLFMDTLGSPGDKIKFSALKKEALSPESMSIIGTMLTEKVKNSEGEFKSALDSKYLQSLMGISHSNLEPSKFTPGVSVLESSAFQSTKGLEDQTATACNAILSPAAMYSAMALDMAVTVAASSTIVLGVIKVVGSWAISEVISHAAESVIGDAAEKALVAIAENKDLANARGEELGTAIAISASAFFSAGAMSRHLPALTKTGLKSFSQLKRDNDQFEREMDIATLSPFDTSSRYTFLGSILYKMKLSTIHSGGYNNPYLSTISTLIRTPSMALSFSNTAMAADYSNYQNTCSYAKKLGMETFIDGRDMTPAIGMSGLPCGGITKEQNAISTEEAIDLISERGWISEGGEEEIKNGDTIQDLIDKKIIKEDTPLSDYLESCGDPSTGDYLLDSAGCVMEPFKPTAKKSGEFCYDTDDGKEVCSNIEEDSNIEENEEYSSIEQPERVNDRALMAIPVFLIDYQISSSINGEDDE